MKIILPVFILLAMLQTHAQHVLYNTSLTDSTQMVAYIGNRSQFSISGVKSFDKIEIRTGQGLTYPNERHAGKFGYYCKHYAEGDTIKVYKNKKLILKTYIELRIVPVPVFFVGNFTDSIIDLEQLKENNILRVELPGCLLKTEFKMVKFQVMTYTAGGDLLTESEVIEGNTLHGAPMEAIQNLTSGEMFTIYKPVVTCADCVMPSILPSKQFIIK